MACTIKLIVKIGLIAEILTAIIGTIGEFTFRYQTYSLAMDELFGPYFEPLTIVNDDGTIIANMKIYAKHHHHLEWPSNHQHYDHHTGEIFSLSELNAIANNNTDAESNITVNNYQQNYYTRHHNHFHPSYLTKFFTNLSTWLFSHHSSSSLMFDNGDNSRIQRNIDPRPLLMLSILVILNFLFILVVAFEYLSLIAIMGLIWVFYLIMLFVIVRVMNDGSVKNQSLTLISPQDRPLPLTITTVQWSELLPSPFLILVVTIIILFALILIALITEERRQYAARIKNRTACIPLVKARDMDLDDI